MEDGRWKTEEGKRKMEDEKRGRKQDSEPVERSLVFTNMYPRRSWALQSFDQTPSKTTPQHHNRRELDRNKPTFYIASSQA